ncbi:hypothetical protein SRHO_G00228490 [Serrasalmus rhombeus]
MRADRAAAQSPTQRGVRGAAAPALHPTPLWIFQALAASKMHVESAGAGSFWVLSSTILKPKRCDLSHAVRAAPRPRRVCLAVPSPPVPLSLPRPGCGLPPHSHSCHWPLACQARVGSFGAEQARAGPAETLCAPNSYSTQT